MFFRKVLRPSFLRSRANAFMSRRNMGGGHGRPGEFVDPLPHAVQPWHKFWGEACMTTMWLWIFIRFYYDYNLLLGVYNPFEGGHHEEEMTTEDVERLLNDGSSSDSGVANSNHRYEEMLSTTKPRRRNTAEMQGES
eukprot:g2227.t1